MKPRLRLLAPILVAAALGLAGCGQNPAQTEHARGLISGANLVLAMTIILVVVSAAFVAGALLLDRAVKTRRALAEAPAAPPAEEDTAPEVVAGITVGRAPVPRWLYGAYVVIPVFALLYVLNGVALAPKAKPKHKTTTAVATGPVTQATVAASGIKFDTSSLTIAANSSITITFKNNDAGVPHNFTIWPSQAVAQSGDTGKAIKAGNTITGVATTTETFKSGPPGTLFYECTIHPTSMFGTMTVSSAPAGGGAAAAAGPSTQAAIAASGIKFDKSTLSLKANSSVSVTFTNNDAGVPHNFTVWPSQAVAEAGDTSKAIKPGNTITGVAKTTETFKTGPPGKLFFECTIHPTSMFGTIVLS